MGNKKELQGKLGIYLVLSELIKNGIDAIPTPHFWIFDIITMNGIKLEVKFSNIGLSRGGGGNYCKRFAFRISPLELSIADFIILVPNTDKEYIFYIIPKKEITSKNIAFNPFSRQKNRYEQYRNRWDLIKKSEDVLCETPIIRKHFEKDYNLRYGLKKPRNEKG